MRNVRGDQFLLWAKEVDLQAEQGVDPVEQVDLQVAAVAVIPDGLPHHRPVLLLHVAAVVFVPGRARVKVILFRSQ